jgi:mono/diheme cytochrome c family protein
MGRIQIVRHSILLVFALAFALAEAWAQQGEAGGSTAAEVTYAVQGWSPADRDTLYTTSQGSHMMPYVWFKALRRLDMEEPFAADKLQRYGYLPNDVSASNPEGLPVGFVIDGSVTSGQVGMTCAACHTGQLEYKKDGVSRVLRLDGAPANADFQGFLTDLLAASRATLMQPDRFDAFARSVLGAGHTTAKAAQVKEGFGKWVAQFGEFMDRSLPAASPWGPGRLDAFGMIFNRVTGRDLGLPGNIKTADAPVSYPFLWNASRQDRTQWNGGVPNGLYIQGLGRNTGEVLGVFADFLPHRITEARVLLPAVIDYGNHSIKFAGLQSLEEKIAVLRPPTWPREIFELDDSLVVLGKPLFEAHCAGCHAVQPSLDLPGLWRTPVLAVGTDPKMAVNAARISDAGLLAGALKPPPAIGARIPNPAKATDLLATAVVGSLIWEALVPPIPPPAKLTQSGVFRALRKDFAEHFPDENLEALLNPRLSPKDKLDAMAKIRAFIETRLSNMFNPPSAVAGPAYESRVLSGIWATAPYLHNGSVPNLWELLKPAKERRRSFMVGSRVFDSKNVGYDTENSPFKSGSFVVDPANGNGNGGHEYGTALSEEQRWAIIEYMKTL